MSSYLSIIPMDKNSNTKSIISTEALKYLSNFSINQKSQDKSMNLPSLLKRSSNSAFNSSFQKNIIENERNPFSKNFINSSNFNMPQSAINYSQIKQLSCNNMPNTINISYNNNSSFLNNMNITNYLAKKKINKSNFYNNKKVRHRSDDKGNNKRNFLDLIIKNKQYKEPNYYSIRCGKDFVKELDCDSLNIIQKNLQNKLYYMGKGSDFNELETTPLEISINKLNIRQKKIISSQNIPNYKKNILLNSPLNKYIYKEIHSVSPSNQTSKFYQHYISSNKQKNSESPINEEDVEFLDKYIPSLNRKITNENNKKEINLKNSHKNISKELKNYKNQYSEDKLCEHIDKFRNFERKKLVYDSLDDEEILEDVIEESFYISPDNKCILIFDTLIFLSSLYIFIITPLDIILERCNNSHFKVIINTSVDILFIIDFILNFFRAYYNFEEQLFIKPDKIIKNYLSYYFLVDIISIIPFYSIFHFNSNNYNICTSNFTTINKQYYKIFSLLKIIKFINSRNKNKNRFIKNCFIHLIKYSFFEKWSFLLGCIIIFLLILHTTACFHIFISTLAYPNWITQQNLQSCPFLEIYICSIYFLIATVTSIGYGDLIGNSFIEIIFQIFLLIVGIVSYSWLISYLSNYIKEKNKNNEIFMKKLNILEDIRLENLKMPKELYNKIISHLEYTSTDQKKNKTYLIDSLPYSIQKSILYEMYKPIIKNFHFFNNFHNSEFINRVISKLNPMLAHKNDLLIEQGDIIEDTFFVKQGRLSLEIKIDSEHPERSIEKLLNEEYFLSIENNNIIQSKSLEINNFIANTNIANKNDFSLLNLSTINNKSLFNPKSIENLYSRKDKSILNQTIYKSEIQAHPNLNIKYIHLKILDIRKNEHFGALLMFLNQRSPLSLRVKTKKAELYILKKIDAVEISSSYPNIWKRVNKKSFHNLKQIKIKMKKIITHFCDSYGIGKFLKLKTINKNNTISNTSLKKSKSTVLTTNKHKFEICSNGTKSKSSKKCSSKFASLFKNKLNKNISNKDIYNQYTISKIKCNTLKNPILKIINNNGLDKISDDISEDDYTINLNEIPKINIKKSNEHQISELYNISSIKTNKKINFLQENRPINLRGFADNPLYSIKSINKSNSILLNQINDLSKTFKMEDNEPRLVLNGIINKTNFLDIGTSSLQINNECENEEINNLIKNYQTSYYSEGINDELYPGENFKSINIENGEKQYDNNIFSIVNNNYVNNERKLLPDAKFLTKNMYKNNNFSSKSLPILRFKNKIFNISFFKCSENNLKSKTVSYKNQQNLHLSRFSLSYVSNFQNNKKYNKNIPNNNTLQLTIVRTSLEFLSGSKAFDDLANEKSNMFNKIKGNKSSLFNIIKSEASFEKYKSSSDPSSYNENDNEKIYNESNNRSKSYNKNKKSNTKIITNRNKTVKNSDMKNNLENQPNQVANTIRCKNTGYANKLLLNNINNVSNTNCYNIGNKLKLSKINFSMKIKSAYKNFNKLSNYQYSKDKEYQKIIKNMIKNRYKEDNKFKESNIIKNVKKFSTYNDTFGLNDDDFDIFKRNISKRFQKEKTAKIKKNTNDNNRKLSINKDENLFKQHFRKSKKKDEVIMLANENLKKDTAVLKNSGQFYSGFFKDLMHKGKLSSNKIDNIKNVNKLHHK